MKRKRNIWIVIPAWKRYEISEVVFSEIRWMMDATSEFFDISAVVISDDYNIEIAKKNGLYVVNSKNDFLGKKFNDGYEFAFKHNADAVIPSGSDSFIHPDYLLNSVMTNYRDNGTIVYATKHAMINEIGNKVGIVDGAERNKGALWVYPRSLMAKSKFRPCKDKINSSCDRSTIDGLEKNSRKVVTLFKNNINDFQYLAIKNNKVQIWGYELYRPQFIKEYDYDIFKIISRYYPEKIVKSIGSIYENN